MVTIKDEKKGTWFDEIKSLILAFAFAMGIQTIAYQPFYIPSGSMKPNLLIGDFLFVNKFCYGYSQYSIPLNPALFKDRIFGSPPQRGDVVVFRAPHKNSGSWFKDEKQDWIKRCVGLPGDKIQMRGGILFINDQECHLEKLPEDFEDTLTVDYYSNGTYKRVLHDKGALIEQYQQTLPNGVKHIIIKEKDFGQARLDNTPEIIIPENNYFMMGDNRDGSDDSRNQDVLGVVPYENIIGRADLIFFSTSARWWEFWKWPTGLRFERLFKLIQ